MENTDKVLFGKEAKEFRKARIKELIGVVKGNRGWREAFIQKYTHMNTLEVGAMLSNGSAGRTSDVELLKCLEEFIPFVIETQPVWFVKQRKIETE